MLPKLTVPFFILFMVCSCSSSYPLLNTDHNALLSFKADTDMSNSLSSWVNSTDPCSNIATWIGVTCNPTTLRVTKLVLDNMNLSGSVHSLSRLTELRVISLKRNRLSSWSSSEKSINLSAWPNLKHFYLSHNRFAEKFPAGISSLHRLQRFDISDNVFYGEIPMTELTQLPRLLTLRLERNSFAGAIDSLPSKSITDFNVSYNEISGDVPPWMMAKFPPSAFAGNQNLAGHPLPVNISGGMSVGRRPLSGAVRLLVIVAILVVLVLVVSVIATCYVYLRKRRYRCGAYKPKSWAHKESGGGGLVEDEVLVVFEGWNMGFNNVGELLKSSAELLGKGSVGTTYKVVVDGRDAVPVVVKRIRDQRRRRRKEVEGWLAVIGGLRHENVVSLRAYYNSSDELLLVYDYLPNGSLHHLLHANRGPWRIPLDWPKRLRLATASAKGLAFLHNYNKAKLFHGHLTSSNIIIDQLGNAHLTDIGLYQLLHTSPSSNNGYTAPELTNSTNSQKVLPQKADVYSFGVILLELLTAKMVTGEEGIRSLVKRVARVARREELTMEVFDIELMSNKVMEEQMVALLQVSLRCLAPLPKDRPKMNKVLRMIDDIRTNKGVAQNGGNFIMMHDASSNSAGSTPGA